MGVSDLAKKLKMAKSTVHGMTSALEELGAAMRDPQTKKYKLGFALLEIGRSAYSQIDLQTSARPVTEELMEKNTDMGIPGYFELGPGHHFGYH